MFQLIIGLCLAVTFTGLRAQVPMASTVLTNTSISISVSNITTGNVMSVRRPKAAESTAVPNDAPTVRCRNVDILSGFPCILSDCGRFRKIECNGATDRDLRAVFAQYNSSLGQGQSVPPSVSSIPPSIPLVVRLNGGTVNLTRGLFKAVAEQMGKMELNQVALPAGIPDEVFSDLKNLSVLDFNGVLVERIPAGAFRGLTGLQALSLRNLTSLESIQSGALDPIPTNTVFRCLNVNVTNSGKFICDCNTNTWLQRTLMTATKLNNNGTWSDMYGESNNALLPCAIEIVCSSNSKEAFRQNLMDLNLDKLCSTNAMSTSPKTENVTMTAMTSPGTSSPSTSTPQSKLVTAIVVPVPAQKKEIVNGATTLTSFSAVVTFIMFSGLTLL